MSDLHPRWQEHHRNGAQFKCPCGRLYRWRKDAQRGKDFWWLLCDCGVLHTKAARNFRGEGGTKAGVSQ